MAGFWQIQMDFLYFFGARTWKNPLELIDEIERHTC